MRYDNANKTMSPDFLYDCHGNQAPANQVFFRCISNLKTKIKNPETNTAFITSKIRHRVHFVILMITKD